MVFQECLMQTENPYSSIVRTFVTWLFKGYIIVYKIDDEKKIIDIFGFTKYENDPFLM